MSVVEQGLVISGDIFGEDSLTVKGVVKGSIFLPKGGVQITQSGYVEGEILANQVIITGELLGNLTALTSSELTSTAKVVGNICTAKITMADGAVLFGHLDIREPEPYEAEIQDFSALSEEDYEKLRLWRVRNHVE